MYTDKISWLHEHACHKSLTQCAKANHIQEMQILRGSQKWQLSDFFQLRLPWKIGNVNCNNQEHHCIYCSWVWINRPPILVYSHPWGLMLNGPYQLYYTLWGHTDKRQGNNMFVLSIFSAPFLIFCFPFLLTSSLKLELKVYILRKMTKITVNKYLYQWKCGLKH